MTDKKTKNEILDDYGDLWNTRKLYTPIKNLEVL